MKAVDERYGMIETAATPEQVRWVYDLWSHFYGWWVSCSGAEPTLTR